MAHPVHTVDQKLAGIAHRSHGVVTRSEALGAGITTAEITRRVRSGALLRVHRGVYRVGHRAPSVEATYLAAVRACGDGAVLSGRAAGHLLGLLRGRPPRPEVTTLLSRRPEGVRIRRTRGFHAEDVTVWRGVPITSVARTLVDLAAVLGPAELARIGRGVALPGGHPPPIAPKPRYGSAGALSR